MEYFCVGIFGILGALIAQRLFKRNLNLVGFIILVVAILPSVFLAGMRSTDLGFDTAKYGVSSYENAAGMSDKQYFNYLKESSREKGFLIAVWILDRCCDNINFVLGGLQFILAISVCIFAYYYRNKSNIIMILILYFCSLYPQSYNVLRQCLSLAMCFIFCIYLDKKKYVKALIFMYIGMQCHNSGFMMIPFWFISYFCDSKKLSLKSKVISLSITIGVILILLLNYTNIIKLLYNFHIINARYLYYLNSSSMDNYDSIRISPTMLFLKTVTIILCTLYYYSNKIDREAKAKNFKWYFFIIIDYFISFLSFKLRNTYRISWYFYYPALFIFYPQIMKIFKNNKINHFLGYCLLSISFIMVFIVDVIVRNLYGIYPYK